MKRERQYAEVLIEHEKPRSFKKWWELILKVADKHRKMKEEKKDAIR